MSAWWQAPARPVHAEAQAAARARQDSLTKPPGALGHLEDVAVRLAGLQGNPRPSLERVRIVVFAADHGIAAEGVSAFPQAVTVEMVRNFVRGGAAISVLAREMGAALEVVDAGTAADPGPLPGVISRRAGPGTANFRHRPAMDCDQFDRCLEAGCESARRAVAAGAQLFIGGEMGIANTTAATAVACALLGVPAGQVAGPGTGLDRAGVRHKAEVVDDALRLHAAGLDDPREVLRRVGGFEIVALAGACIACAQAGVAVLVDGFIASVAALAAVRLNPSIAPWLLYAHRSAEPGHALVLEALDARPLLDLGMRLGEGSGAAVAVPLLRAALALHNGMATFAEAGVSGG